MSTPVETPATTSLTIGGITVGPDAPPFVIAEMSGNHDGSLDKALEIVRMAAKAGAHAIKLQTYTADTITIDVDKPEFRLSEDHELWAVAPPLRALRGGAHARGSGTSRSSTSPASWASSPSPAPSTRRRSSSSRTSRSPAYKIASSEIVDLPLIRLAAQTGKPLIISTGMASVGEIAAAVEAAHSHGQPPGHAALLHRQLPRRPRLVQPARHPGHA